MNIKLIEKVILTIFINKISDLAVEKKSSHNFV